MTTFRSLLLMTIFLGLVPAAGAQSLGIGTVSQFLSSFAATPDPRCETRAELESGLKAQGKKGEARSAHLAAATVCDCMPAQARSLQSTLPKTALDESMTDADFQRRYMPQIADHCAAEQMRATYGDGCSEQFASVRSNSKTYCACMHTALTELPDTTIAELGKASSDYMPRAAAARQRGEQPPPPPPSIVKFASIDGECRVR
jgi:hypothetical protein